MSRSGKVLMVAAGLFAAAVFIAVTCVVHTHTVKDSVVVAYNDGWLDAKADDCQQGDTSACQWLNTQK